MVTIIQKKIHGHTEVLEDMVARLVESLATGSMAGTFLYEISLICLLLIYGCNTCRVDASNSSTKKCNGLHDTDYET